MATARENRYDSLVQFYADGAGLDFFHVKAQLIEESALDPRAVSHTGAQGLAQFEPATWQEWGRGDPFNPEESIRAQTAYVAFLLRTCLGDWDKAFACYNWGLGNIRKAGADWRDALPAETSSYLARINATIARLKGALLS
jgi:soluble lytic murein transglycosylase-like protein